MQTATATARDINQELLARRVAAFNNRPGARIGDFIRLPDLHPKLGKWTRITHDHGDLLQTGGHAGSSYYFGSEGYLSYSGGLDHGVSPDSLIPTNETRTGTVWFFDRDISGAGRGINFQIDCRIFTIREGTDLDGIAELQCPYSLCVLDEDGNKRTCNYWYLIHHHAMSHKAFRDRAELDRWLASNGLQTTRPFEHGVSSFQRLAYTPAA